MTARFWRSGMALALALTLAACNLLPGAAPALPPTPSAAPPQAETPASPTALPPATPTPAPSAIPTPVLLSPEYLVLIVLDAARPDYFNAVELPALQRLIQNGAYYPSAWVGAMENSTPAGHVQISTGVFPAHSGITGHVLRSNPAGIHTDITSDDYILSGQFAALVAQSGAPTLAGLIKAKYPDDSVMVISGDKHYAAQSLGVGPADFILYAHVDEDYRSISLRALPGHSPAADILADSRLNGQAAAPGDVNGFTLNAARVLFEQYHPRALLITLPETDDLGHASGADPAVIAPALQKTDSALAALVDTYQQAGIFEQTLWVVTSDHGMSAKFAVIDPEAVLAEAGVQLQEGENPRIPLYLNDPARAPILAAQIARAAHPAIQGVYYRNSHYFPVIINEKSSSLDGVYSYLLSTYASPYTPDVVVFAADGAVFDDTLNQSGGEHTMTNWRNQNIPLLFSGPGVLPGGLSYAPARLVDVLPTIALLMGLETGDTAGEIVSDGVALADALAAPPPDALAAQNDLNAWLAPLRDALEAQALQHVP